MINFCMLIKNLEKKTMVEGPYIKIAISTLFISLRKNSGCVPNKSKSKINS